jgi:hypothetical protein
LTKGKFPMGFEASEGASEVRSLIEAVQDAQKNDSSKRDE